MSIPVESWFYIFIQECWSLSLLESISNFSAKLYTVFHIDLIPDILNIRNVINCKNIVMQYICLQNIILTLDLFKYLPTKHENILVVAKFILAFLPDRFMPDINVFVKILQLKTIDTYSPYLKHYITFLIQTCNFHLFRFISSRFNH
jgi:hypothetical protein